MEFGRPKREATALELREFRVGRVLGPRMDDASVTQHDNCRVLCRPPLPPSNRINVSRSRKARLRYADVRCRLDSAKSTSGVRDDGMSVSYSDRIISDGKTPAESNRPSDQTSGFPVSYYTAARSILHFLYTSRFETLRHQRNSVRT